MEQRIIEGIDIYSGDTGSGKKYNLREEDRRALSNPDLIRKINYTSECLKKGLDLPIVDERFKNNVLQYKGHLGEYINDDKWLLIGADKAEMKAQVENIIQDGFDKKKIPVKTKHQICVMKMNQKFATILNGSRFAVMMESFDPVFKRKDLRLLSKKDFLDLFQNEQIENPEHKKDRRRKKKISVAEFWLEHPDRRHYNGIVFAPGEKIESYYNLYNGLTVEPKSGDWPLMKRHVVEVIANGDHGHARWIFAWVARIIQDPGGQRPGTALVLRGPQGCGKGALLDNIGKGFGAHYRHITNQAHVSGRFNQHLKDAIFVFADETFWRGNKSDTAVLKGLITEDTHMIEPKGKDPFEVKSHVNVVIASNATWIVPAGLEERRFCVVDVSGRKIGDRAYFDALYNEMNNGGREAMFYELLNMDISGVDLRTIPRTDALFDQVVASMPVIEKFWLHRLSVGSIRGEESESGWYPEDEHKLRDIYGDFSRFSNLYQMTPNRMIPSQFSKKLGEICPGLVRFRKEYKGESSKDTYLMFPPLDVCRCDFERKIGREISWDDDGVFDEAGVKKLKDRYK